MFGFMAIVAAGDQIRAQLRRGSRVVISYEIAPQVFYERVAGWPVSAARWVMLGSEGKLIDEAFVQVFTMR